MSATSHAKKPLKWSLNFDLNRTILMSDAAGGRSMGNTINYVLTECSWGYKDESNEWVCVSSEPSVTPPPSAAHKSLITYKAFVEDLFPFESIESHFSSDEIAKVKSSNKESKKNRTKKQSEFTAAGNPGESLFSFYEKAMEKLHFPKGSIRENAQRVAAELSDSKLKEAWTAGRYYLLPSFLHALFHIANLQEQNLNVEVIFRTFGNDIPEVKEEIDILIEGRHPLFPDAKLPSTMALSDQYATFFRDGYGPMGTTLAVGTLEKVPSNGGETPKEFYEKSNENVNLLQGFSEIHGYLSSVSNGSCDGKKNPTVHALRDYWEWWNAHAEHGEYGKLLLVSRESNEVNVFFDDHVEHDHAHIVDVREVETGNEIPFEEAKVKHLRKVQPYLAIMDEKYYIELINECIENSN